jgi:hypothetical protein
MPGHWGTGAPASSSGFGLLWPAPVVDRVYVIPAFVADPIEEIVAATAGFNEVGDSLVGQSQSKINIAHYHAKSVRQMLPNLTAWPEERAQSVNSAIAAMERAHKGREANDDISYGLRQTVMVATKRPRSIDTMVALSERSVDVDDLLKAHDKYSIGIRTALIDFKAPAVEYLCVPKKRRAPAWKITTSRSPSSTLRAKDCNPSSGLDHVDRTDAFAQTDVLGGRQRLELTGSGSCPNTIRCLGSPGRDSRARRTTACNCRRVAW